MNDANVRLYLSRLVLDLNCRQVWSELAQPYEMHRTLMHAFPEAPFDDTTKARERYGVLFRADMDGEAQCVRVYVQSRDKPDWSFLDKRTDYLCADVDGPKDVAPTYAQLQDDQILSFRLRANPTKRLAIVAKADQELKGKRVGLLREEEQIAWLARKGRERENGISGGFEILVKEVEDGNGHTVELPCVRVRREGKLAGYKRANGRSHQMTHLTVRFDGLLRITNADAFRGTLASGIGPAKAFGFGLLSIAKV